MVVAHRRRAAAALRLRAEAAMTAPGSTARRARLRAGRASVRGQFRACPKPIARSAPRSPSTAMANASSTSGAAMPTGADSALAARHSGQSLVDDQGRGGDVRRAARRRAARSPMRTVSPASGRNSRRRAKQDVTVAHMLSHQAGLPGFAEPTCVDELYDQELCADAARRRRRRFGSRAPPTAITRSPTACSSPRSCGESTAGRSAAFIAEELAAPAGADLHIGLPAALENRGRETIPPEAPADLGGIEMNEAMRLALASPAMDPAPSQPAGMARRRRCRRSTATARPRASPGSMRPCCRESWSANRRSTR